MCDGVLWPFAGYHKAATFFFIVSFQLLINHTNMYMKAQQDSAKNRTIRAGLTNTLYQDVRIYMIFLSFCFFKLVFEPCYQSPAQT